jgi:hypothetical protein
MAYSSQTPTAMILPIPTVADTTAEAIRFADLSEYDAFFKHLDRGFPQQVKMSLPFSRIVTSSKSSQLAVTQVGSYIASFVPNVFDFDRLAPQFSIPSETWLKIPAYKSYSFVVFQLAELSAVVHPMAFEFPTRLVEQLFFPTVHIHDGEVHDRESFDHQLYCQHAGFDSVVSAYQGRREVQATTGWVRSKGTAEDFVEIDRSRGLVEPDLLVHRRTMQGRLANVDTLVAAPNDPLVPSFNPRMLWRYWPAAMAVPFAVAPFAWLIQRRNQIRKAKQTGA